jgi:uncharacterized membrane protein YkvA (DUF1232 family)
MDNRQIDLISKELPNYRRGRLVEVWDDISAMWAWLTDPEAPIWGKVIILACLVYVISPLDAIPDVIPVVGLSDDVAVVLAAACKLGSELNRYKRKL